MSCFRHLARLGWLLGFLPGWPALRAAPPSLQQYLEGMGYVAVPFDNQVDISYYKLDAVLNGKPVRFAVDTGSPMTLLDTGEAGDIKTLSELHQKLRDPSGALITDPDVLLLDSLQLGPATFLHQPALRRDLEMDSVPLGFGGILGLDFLLRQSCLIDCGDQKLYLHGAPLTPAQLASLKQTLAKTGFLSVPIRHEKRLRVRSTIDGKPLDWMIDTGARYTMIDQAGEALVGLHPVTEIRTGSNIPQPIQRELRGFKGIGFGNQTAHFLKLDKLELGDRTWRQLFVLGVDFDLSDGEADDPASLRHGILGQELLTNDGAIIDPRDGMMWFRHAAPHRY